MASAAGSDSHPPEKAGFEAGTLALNWLDRDLMPRLICSETLELVWINQAGQDQLRRGGDLELRDGQVHCRNRASQANFAAFVEGCDSALMSSLCLPCDGGDGYLLIRARQIGADAEQRYVGLSFHYTGSGFRAVYADLDKVFQLTPSEHRVLGAMIEGQTADQIAEAMRLSIETVRSHIRHIYIKMDVTSREALFSKIRPFRI